MKFANPRQCRRIRSGDPGNPASRDVSDPSCAYPCGSARRSTKIKTTVWFSDPPRVHRDVRYQVLQSRSWILAAPPTVLTKNSRQRHLGDSARTLLSSGCHMTELCEGTWTLARNFGRTVGVVSAGSSKNDTSLRQRLDDIV
jgi:hypothetical protein